MRILNKIYILISIGFFFFLLLRWNTVFLDFKCLRDPGCREDVYEQIPCDQVIVTRLGTEMDILLMLALFVFIGVIINIVTLFKTRKNNK